MQIIERLIATDKNKKCLSRELRELVTKSKKLSQCFSRQTKKIEISD